MSVAATHRRQGILRRLLGAVHADIDDARRARGRSRRLRGCHLRPLRLRRGHADCAGCAIDVRAVRLRDELVPKPGSVRFMEHDEARGHVAGRLGARPPPASRRDGPQRTWWDMVFADQAKAQDGFSPVVRLRHDDGYAAYRVRMEWNEGRPAHQVDLIELVAGDRRRAPRALAHPARHGPGGHHHLPAGRGPSTTRSSWRSTTRGPSAPRPSTTASGSGRTSRPTLLGARTYMQRGPPRPGAAAGHDGCRRCRADPLGGRGRT